MNKIAVMFMLVLLSGCNEKLRPHLNDLLGESLTISIIGDPPEKIREIKLPKIPDVTRDALTFGGFKGEKQINMKVFPPGKMNQLNIQFIQEAYKEVRGTKASNGDLKKWINVLKQGGTREGLYRALVLDTNYYKLERKNIPLTDSAIDFASSYSKKYIGKEISSDTLERINFYRLKRELTDRSLEVVDSLSANLDDVYDWYAVFSSELATKYSKVWKLKIRGNASKDFQRNWAQGVPVQMMKSEIILKINRLINLLNK